jgi:hypothetical protein
MLADPRFAAGTSTGGSGPSYIQRKQREYVRQIIQAKQFGADILLNEQNDNEGRKKHDNVSMSTPQVIQDTQVH